MAVKVKLFQFWDFEKKILHSMPQSNRQSTGSETKTWQFPLNEIVIKVPKSATAIAISSDLGIVSKRFLSIVCVGK